ncbi:hypothetical protein PGT21_015128 [Puccinia graminis f. sp. tritici]|uniref:Uncharacterized protein n=1 Tax=Puccinia graminis f. sp. tritici TaxID=56615 RepID=A0A5B0MB90_PUCGR|nr:hypothetical protein PGT21_015128 [Puccinia graminis f. sp. tritici]
MSNLDQEKFENGNVVAPSVGLYETEKGTPVGKSANAKGKGKALESKSVSKKRCGASTPDAQLKQLGHLLQENEYLLEEALTIDLGIQNLESHGGKLVGTRNEVLSALKILKKWIKPQSVKTKLTWLIAKPWCYCLVHLSVQLLAETPSFSNPLKTGMSTVVGKYLDPRNICVVNGGQEQSTAK